MSSPPSAPLSKGARLIMFVILGVLILLSLYANVQRLRRDKIETVTFTPATESSPLPSASPR